MAATAEPRERHQQLKQLSEDKRSERRPKNQSRQPMGKNQCAYCKEEGHWVRDCPKKMPKVKVLAEDDE